jgi:pSer/pThr/pTyr-binding forkhead associated (FHA) protein
MAYIHLDNDPSHRHELTQPVTTVGRAETNDIVLDGDMRVSRQHARLNLQEGQWVLTDSNSANGTLVNGERVTSHSLRHGDRIRFGDATFVFVPVADPLAPITEVKEEESVGTGVRSLSVRERELLTLVGAGRTDKEIAEDLFISVTTVRSHLDRIRDKTGARRRPELTRLAMELDGS